MLTAVEAQEFYDSLFALLAEFEDARIRRVSNEVRAAVARGKPLAAQVRTGGLRKRESVRSVAALDAYERLEILVRALDFCLVTPVDLAEATLSSLNATADMELAMEFHEDVARSVDSRGKGEVAFVPRDAGSESSGELDHVLITLQETEEAALLVLPLRSALAAVLAELPT